MPLQHKLLGRDSDLAALNESIRQHRLVTLTGPCGVGKTRLSRRAAAHWSARNSAEAVWVDLAFMRGTSDVLTALLQALGSGASGSQSLADLTATLRTRRLLLVFDGAIDDSATSLREVIVALLAGVPDARVLVTSPRCLGLVGERRLPLAPFVPAARTGSRNATPGAALLLLKAQEIEPAFFLHAGDVHALARICRQLQGNALAIEMAAALAPALGVPALASALSDRVATGSTRAMWSSLLAWSCALLGASERSVLRRLAVFPGAFSLADAMRVVPETNDDTTRLGAIDALDTLVERSLVLASDDAMPTYRLPEPTRRFAAQQLAEAGEAEAWQARLHRPALPERPSWPWPRATPIHREPGPRH
jgi:predicted ATPase